MCDKSEKSNPCLIALTALTSILSNRVAPQNNISYVAKYVTYLYNVNTIVFINLAVIKEARSHLSSMIITKVSLFIYVIYFSGACE